MKHVVIVGAGLFGSIAAALAQRSGFRVTLIDRGEARAGSGPAACLMKPGWFSGLSNKDVESGLQLLHDLYGVETLPFVVNGVAPTLVQWVDPKKILSPWVQFGQVTRIKGDVTGFHAFGAVQYRVDGDDEVLPFDFCLVAAGVWSPKLAPVPGMKALAGAAFTFDVPCPEPFIKVWAPYKQLVGFEREPGKMWIGDGSAILEKNWTTERMEQSRGRCSNAAGVRALGCQIVQQQGLRPYVEGHKAGYFAKVGDRTWVSTGGAKNGTIIAAIQAKRFVDAITQ